MQPSLRPRGQHLKDCDARLSTSYGTQRARTMRPSRWRTASGFTRRATRRALCEMSTASLGTCWYYARLGRSDPWTRRLTPHLQPAAHRIGPHLGTGASLGPQVLGPAADRQGPPAGRAAAAGAAQRQRHLRRRLLLAVSADAADGAPRHPAARVWIPRAQLVAAPRNVGAARVPTRVRRSAEPSTSRDDRWIRP